MSARCRGSNLLLRDGNGTLNATVTGNTISNPGTFATNAINVSDGALATGSQVLVVTKPSPNRPMARREPCHSS